MEAALFIFLFVIVMLIVPWMMSPAWSDRGTPAFSSDRERRLWLWVLVVVAAIYSTLGPAAALVAALREHNLLRVSSILVLILIVGAVIWHWVKRRPSRAEVGVALGVTVAYLTAWLRIDRWEERTHLFEYGLVAVLIHQALTERLRRERRILVPAALAVVMTALLGWLDEGIQAILPGRVYDIRDIAFNSLAALMAIGASLALRLVRRRKGKARIEQ